MKKILLTLIALFVIPTIAIAQVLTLNSPETLSPPTAAKLELRSVNINVSDKRIDVIYHFLTSGDIPIMASMGVVDRTWTCRDADAVPAFNPATCTGVGVPNPCCTGVGTGSGCFAGTPAETCFTDTFSFVIRTQDAGTPIGKGLRALIWAKMRPAVLTGANNATLP